MSPITVEMAQTFGSEILSSSQSVTLTPGLSQDRYRNAVAMTAKATHIIDMPMKSRGRLPNLSTRQTVINVASNFTNPTSTVDAEARPPNPADLKMLVAK
mmetsp:Transcript_31317/g.71497  ORF Transcript_31317/g.71497 Transcript_31317/m.71497 type:complete len:100 (+) Transcript_31317:450-749(+)